MRSLTTTQTAYQKKPSVSPLYKVVLTSGATTHTYDKSRIKHIEHDEYPFSQTAKIILSNADNVLTPLTLKGYVAVISYGLITGSKPTWLANTAYSLGDFVSPTVRNGYKYKCTDAGTSGDWVSPTSATDDDSAWTNDATAYDGNVTTKADLNLAALTWSSYLKLNIASTNCNGVKYDLSSVLTGNITVDVDIYHSGAWHDLYEGVFTDTDWDTKTFTQQAVTSVRIRFYNSHASLTKACYIREVMFAFEPTWPATLGETVNDGTVIWTNDGPETEEYEATDPLVVIGQELLSSQGNLICELTLQGIPDNLQSDKANADYEWTPWFTDPIWQAGTAYLSAGPQSHVTAVVYNGFQYKCTQSGTSGGTEPVWPTALETTVVDGTVWWELHTGHDNTVKDLLNRIFVKSNGLPCFDHYAASQYYTVVWDSEDDIIDTFMPMENFIVHENESRLAVIKKLLDYTGCAMRYTDGAIHIFVPTIAGPPYDSSYELGSGLYNFFAKTYHQKLIIPNYITVLSKEEDGDSFSGSAQDASYGLLPKKSWKRMTVSSNAQAADIATAMIGKARIRSRGGSGTVPLNLGSEIYDYIQITDAREDDEIFGNIGWIHRRVDPAKKVWEMAFGFGEWADYQGILDKILDDDGANDEMENFVTNLVDEQIIDNHIEFVPTTLTDVTASRSIGTVAAPDIEQNTSGRSMIVYVYFDIAQAAGSYAFVISYLGSSSPPAEIGRYEDTSDVHANTYQNVIMLVVPNDWYYMVNKYETGASVVSLDRWVEQY